MIGSLRREVFDRLLIVNEHHLRRVLTGYLRHYNTARPHRALGQLAPLKLPAGHRRSTSPSTGSAGNKSSAGSRASIRSPPDGLAAAEGAGHRHDRVFEPHRFAGHEMTRTQLGEFTELFGTRARTQYDESNWRITWADALTGVTLVSDGHLPFRDNVDHVAESGVARIIEPGGSIRTPEVAAAAAKLGIAHVQTGLRLFHH
jgi:Integrase core domain